MEIFHKHAFNTNIFSCRLTAFHKMLMFNWKIDAGRDQVQSTSLHDWTPKSPSGNRWPRNWHWKCSMIVINTTKMNNYGHPLLSVRATSILMIHGFRPLLGGGSFAKPQTQTQDFLRPDHIIFNSKLLVQSPTPPKVRCSAVNINCPENCRALKIETYESTIKQPRRSPSCLNSSRKHRWLFVTLTLLRFAQVLRVLEFKHRDLQNLRPGVSPLHDGGPELAFILSVA